MDSTEGTLASEDEAVAQTVFCKAPFNLIAYTLSRYCTVRDICRFDQALASDRRLRSYIGTLLAQHLVIEYGDVYHAKRGLCVDDLRATRSIYQFRYLCRRCIQVRGSFVINYNNAASGVICEARQGIAMDDLLYEYPHIKEIELNFGYVHTLEMLKRIGGSGEISKFACNDSMAVGSIHASGSVDDHIEDALDTSANELARRLLGSVDDGSDGTASASCFDKLTSLQVRLPHSSLPYLQSWPYCSFQSTLLELSLDFPYPMNTTPSPTQWKALFDCFVDPSKAMRSIETLRLHMRGLFWHDDSFHQFIKNNKNLKCISLSSKGRGSPIQEKSLCAFTGLTTLGLLEIEQVTVTDATLIDIITANRGLRLLNLGMEEVTDASIEALATLTCLESLDLWCANKVSETHLSVLIESNPYLKSLDLSFVQCITDATLYSMIEHTKNLKHISLAGNDNISKRALLKLVTHFQSSLTRICLQDCCGVNERIITVLEQNDITEYPI